ncbi:MAG: hypothetical protein CBC40_06235 [bacterium TMED80]|nr:MAG: hypothetical protein CBC40_06235 [bacterium TMED80]
MLTDIEKIIFVLFAIVAIGLSYTTFNKMFKAISVGSQQIDWKRALLNFPKGIEVYISQRTLFKTRPVIGFIHALVAWGFTLYLVVNIVDVLYGFIPGFHFFPNYFIGKVYRLFVDIFTVLVLLGVVYFLVRRFIFKDNRLVINEQVMLNDLAKKGMRNDSLIVGFFIFLHVGSRLLAASFEIARNGSDTFQPAATTIALLWSDFSQESIIISEHIFWWIALGLILGFLPYFPFTKHAHLFMGPLNYMVKTERKSMAALEAIDFEDDSIDQFGAGQLGHLPQSQILDAYACIQCSRCQDACPAYETGKELSPSALEINKRYFLNSHLDEFINGSIPDAAITDILLTDEAAWSCTTCGYCVEVCPVGNEPMLDILRARQDLVMMESKFPQEAMETFDKIENYGNPWGLSPQEREVWMEGKEVPLMREKKEAEVLYWAGCAGAYDNRGKEISQAVVDVLNEAKVDFASLGNEETCTGDSARRIGNEYLFQTMAEKNLETFGKYKFKKIVTQCPHCFTTLKNDYSELGADLEVVHHSQFIGELVSEGKISPKAWLDEDVTYHDACYLGRHNDEYDAPRDVIQSIMKNGSLVEMEKSREESFCCGAGGGNMWYEIKTGERINHNRFKQAADTGATTVATSCNFCNIMMEDGMKVTGNDDKMKVMDIAELVSKSLSN